jgi:hypothetical protein
LACVSVHFEDCSSRTSCTTLVHTFKDGLKLSFCRFFLQNYIPFFPVAKCASSSSSTAGGDQWAGLVCGRLGEWFVWLLLSKCQSIAVCGTTFRRSGAVIEPGYMQRQSSEVPGVDTQSQSLRWADAAFGRTRAWARLKLW